ncbi:MAG: Uncharacterised protein [Alphaproteobacteria bacterium UBA4588]|nr:MAG: Uncharacterised protein [Alphaproteobacteria bacterium UBA4588]
MDNVGSRALSYVYVKTSAIFGILLRSEDGHGWSA